MSEYVQVYKCMSQCLSMYECEYVCVCKHAYLKNMRVCMCVYKCECKDMHEYVCVTVYKSMRLRMWVNKCECEYGLRASLVYTGVECCCSLF